MKTLNKNIIALAMLVALFAQSAQGMGLIVRIATKLAANPIKTLAGATVGAVGTAASFALKGASTTTEQVSVVVPKAVEPIVKKTVEETASIVTESVAQGTGSTIITLAPTQTSNVIPAITTPVATTGIAGSVWSGIKGSANWTVNKLGSAASWTMNHKKIVIPAVITAAVVYGGYKWFFGNTAEEKEIVALLKAGKFDEAFDKVRALPENQQQAFFDKTNAACVDVLLAKTDRTEDDISEAVTIANEIDNEKLQKAVLAKIEAAQAPKKSFISKAGSVVRTTGKGILKATPYVATVGATALAAYKGRYKTAAGIATAGATALGVKKLFFGSKPAELTEDQSNAIDALIAEGKIEEATTYVNALKISDKEKAELIKQIDIESYVLNNDFQAAVKVAESLIDEKQKAAWFEYLAQKEQEVKAEEAAAKPARRERRQRRQEQRDEDEDADVVTVRSNNRNQNDGPRNQQQQRRGGEAQSCYNAAKAAVEVAKTMTRETNNVTKTALSKEVAAHIKTAQGLTNNANIVEQLRTLQTTLLKAINTAKVMTSSSFNEDLLDLRSALTA